MSQEPSAYSGRGYLVAAIIVAALVLGNLIGRCLAPASPDQPERPTPTAQSVLVIPTSLPTPQPTMVPMVIVPTVAVVATATLTPLPTATAIPATVVPSNTPFVVRPVETVPSTVTPMLRPPPAPAQIPRRQP